MVKNVLLALFAFVVIGFLILWMLNGGIRRAYVGIKNIAFSASTTEGGVFTLPWQPAGLIPRITDTDLFPDGGYAAPGTPEAELAALQEEYEQISSDVQKLKNIGNPSPVYGKVTISRDYSSAKESYDHEYIALTATHANTAPISLAGWSLRSAVNGLQAPLSSAASVFRMGAVNTLDPIALSPGHTVIIATAASPVGTPFRENKCTGYLSQFQSFTPPLSLRCPAPSEELSLTVENLQQLGPECIDAAAYIPTCEFPNDIRGVSSQCQVHLQTVLSYNGCVGRHLSDTDFFENTWRLFASSPHELWHNSHDAIQLLDAEGRVVDVYVY